MKKIICHNLFREEFEVDSSKLYFRPSIYGILIEDKKVLLSRQHGGYDFPGGGINIDETLDEALKREFWEETGIIIEPVIPIHCETSFFCPAHSPKHKNEYWNCVLIYYLVRKIGGKISKDNFDEEEKNYADLPEWIDIEKITKLKYYNSVDNQKIILKAAELIKSV